MLPFIESVFWTSLFLVFYTYLGYGMVLIALVLVKRLFRKPGPVPAFYPELTLVVPAYNEADCIGEKVANSFALHYPSEKIRYLFISDGSTDGTTEILSATPGIRLIADPERRGKIERLNQAMTEVDTPVVVFSDASTMLHPDALGQLVRYFADPEVGAVAGEKRVRADRSAGAAGAGEGIYWKYESLLKRLDSELKTVVGADGGLFSMRTDLYEPVEKDTVLDDFMISMRLTAKSYRVVYEPAAFALESPSFSVKEEMKRKIRICAGGFQSMGRLSALLNPFRYGLLTFQYVSHRVMRWTVAPLCLLLLLVTSLALYPTSPFYRAVVFGQVFFYLLAGIGFLLESRRVRVKAFFIPFYFSFMNFSVFLGLARYLQNSQSQLWEKARRA